MQRDFIYNIRFQGKSQLFFLVFILGQKRIFPFPFTFISSSDAFNRTSTLLLHVFSFLLSMISFRIIAIFPDSLCFRSHSMAYIFYTLGHVHLPSQSLFERSIFYTFSNPIPTIDMLPSYRTMKYKSPIWGYFHVQKE